MNERQVLYSGKKFRVERLIERLDDGGSHERDIIVHPGAAVILALLPDRKIVMVRNTRPAIDAELLELPAGTLDPDESAAACAARELTEETGYIAGALRSLVQFYSTPGFCTERMHTFIATGLTRGEPHLDRGEKIRVELRTLESALGAIHSGEICDGKTIACLLYYARFARREGIDG